MRSARACRKWRQALWLDADGALGPEERAVLKAHLDECPGCRGADGLVARLDRALAAETLDAPAENFRERVMLGVVSGFAGVRAIRERARAARAPSGEAADWWILLGGLGAAFLIAVISISVLSSVTLEAVSYAVDSPTDAAAAFGGGLLRGFQQGLAACGDSLGGLVRSPLSLGILFLGGFLAATLGWLGHSLARSSTS